MLAGEWSPSGLRRNKAAHKALKTELRAPCLPSAAYTREVIPVAWDDSKKLIPDLYGEVFRARGTSAPCGSCQEAAFSIPLLTALRLEIFAFNGRRDGSGEGGGNQTSRRFTFQSDFLDAAPPVWPAGVVLSPASGPSGPHASRSGAAEHPTSPSVVRSSHPKIVLSLLL